MRVENVSKIDSVLSAKPVKPNVDEIKSAIGKSGYLKDLPKNFKTLDTKTNEPITVGELELIQAIERANNTLRGANTNFEFSIHEQTRAIMVKIINSDTHEIIREIPPEKVLDMVAKMWEMAGILVDRHI